jgi:O-antigen ligase
MQVAAIDPTRVIGATHPHNAYLEALLDAGLAGLALLLAYFLHAYRGLRALGADAALEPRFATTSRRACIFPTCRIAPTRWAISPVR